MVSHVRDPIDPIGHFVDPSRRRRVRNRAILTGFLPNGRFVVVGSGNLDTFGMKPQRDGNFTGNSGRF